MSSKRKRLTPQELTLEHEHIRYFVTDYFRRKEGARLFVADIYKNYQLYRKKNRLGDSKLSLDGFGRMLPHHWERKPISIAGHAARGLIGYAMMDASR